jgi:hypothetical protein
LGKSQRKNKIVKKGEEIMKLIVGGMWHETNTFAYNKTGFEDFDMVRDFSTVDTLSI